MQSALRGLVTGNLVQLGHEDDAGRTKIRYAIEQSLAVLDKIQENVVFSAGKNYWTWAGATPVVFVALTENGLKAARSILQERGYQWWSQGSGS